MYHGDKDKSIDNYFFDFVANNAEHLFYLLRQFIYDMIMEVLLEVQINIETNVNGKQSDLSGLRDDIAAIIRRELQKNK